MKLLSRRIILGLICLAAVAAGNAPAQVSTASRKVARLLRQADSLCRSYDFPAAEALLGKAVQNEEDSLARVELELGMATAQNGVNMMHYCSKPAVVACQRFSLSDFFLFYPLKDRSWRRTPNQLDSLDAGTFVRSTYVPEGARELYFSASDADGIRNIYRTELLDSVWSTPRLINEQMTSSQDEVFPMLSAKGDELYFSSKGLFGVGGYDLYVSRRDPASGDWSAPQNLGFPYSSPYDDFLYMDTDDGKYTIFASNRDCPADSVNIYVLEFDSLPIRSEVESAQELRNLCTLAPSGDPSRFDNGSAVSSEMPDSPEIRLYKDVMSQVRALRDSVALFGRQLEALRANLASCPEEEKEALAKEIISRELKLPSRQLALEKAAKELHKVEMTFLSSGVVIDPDKMLVEADREVVGAASAYTFTKNHPGGSFSMDFEVVVPSFDYTFKILPQAQMAEDQTLPEGIVYQIQLFTGNKVGLAKLKGLSPVYERAAGSSRYVYTAGLFRTYSDVLSHLNSVKKLGFRSAFIVAFKDGKNISVSSARSQESLVKALYKVRITAEGGVLPDITMAAIRQTTDRDIARLAEGGTVYYEVGPLDSEKAAEELLQAVKATGPDAEIIKP